MPEHRALPAPCSGLMPVARPVNTRLPALQGAGSTSLPLTAGLTHRSLVRSFLRGRKLPGTVRLTRTASEHAPRAPPGSSPGLEGTNRQPDRGEGAGGREAGSGGGTIGAEGPGEGGTLAGRRGGGGAANGGGAGPSGRVSCTRLGFDSHQAGSVILRVGVPCKGWLSATWTHANASAWQRYGLQYDALVAVALASRRDSSL